MRKSNHNVSDMLIDKQMDPNYVTSYLPPEREQLYYKITQSLLHEENNKDIDTNLNIPFANIPENIKIL